jgi:YVTN family beta-propeller protein
MSPLKVEEQLRALREQALRREPRPDAWPRLQRRLRREPTRRAVLVAGLVLVVLAGIMTPGLLARRTEQPTVPAVGAPVVPGRPEVTARIRLDRQVGYVAIGFGAIWATGEDRLVRVDLRTNQVVATIPMRQGDLFGGGGSIAFGEGAVWVTSWVTSGEDVVYRVDPATNHVTASIPVPAGPLEVVVAAGTVWVTHGADPGEGFVTRIDARTNKLLTPIQVPTNPGPIRSGLDAVWVVDCCTFGRIDPRRGTVTQSHPVGDIWAVGGGALWGTYTNGTDESGVQRVDPDTGRVLARIPIPHDLAMAYGLGTLWVAQNTSSPPVSPGPGSSGNLDRSTPGRLYRIDPTTNRVLGQPLTLPGIVPAPYLGVVVGEGTVLVVDFGRKTLIRIELVP